MAPSEAAGTDGAVARMRAALRSLGYLPFPFDAFNPDGSLRFDAPLPVPDSWREASGRVRQAPIWDQLYPIISVLDNQIPEWRCYHVGVNFTGGTLRLVVVKGTETKANNTRLAQQWMESFKTIIAQLVEYSGRVTLISDEVAAAVKEFAEWARSHSASQPSGDGNGNGKTNPPAEGLTVPGPPLAEPSTAPVAGQAVVPAGFASALDLLALLAGAASSITRKSPVRCTVLWFSGLAPFPANVQWDVCNIDYVGKSSRTLHMLWNPSWAASTAPAFLVGAPPWKGWAVADMPHAPADYVAAFYPGLAVSRGLGVVYPPQPAAGLTQDKPAQDEPRRDEPPACAAPPADPAHPADDALMAFAGPDATGAPIGSFSLAATGWVLRPVDPAALSSLPEHVWVPAAGSWFTLGSAGYLPDVPVDLMP